MVRAELEEMDWKAVPTDATTCIYDHTGEGGHVATLSTTLPGRFGTLLAAAPELALACLEARAFALRVGEWNSGTPLGQASNDLLRALEAALALAGVQP